MSVDTLPVVNACLNGLATILLTVGFIMIKQGRMAAHRACMLSAFGVSTIFLCTYVLHKYLKHWVNTTIGAEGLVKTLYLVMLATHVVLAMAIVPLVLITLTHAIKGRLIVHRQWARWTFPIWYYVSVTGVLVYFFLYQWWPAAKH